MGVCYVARHGKREYVNGLLPCLDWAESISAQHKTHTIKIYKVRIEGSLSRPQNQVIAEVFNQRVRWIRNGRRYLQRFNRA